LTKRVVTIIDSDLSKGRTLSSVTLAKALEQQYSVQVLGSKFGDEFWPGFDHNNPNFVLVEGRQFPLFFLSLL